MASVVVGVHGGALGHAIWLGPGASVVEMYARSNARNAMWGPASMFYHLTHMVRPTHQVGELLGRKGLVLPSCPAR